MGTSYRILSDGKSDLECHEMSDRFTIGCWQKDSVAPAQDGLMDLTAEQLVKAAIELLKVASYNLDASDIQGIIATERGRSDYYIGVSL